jgi:hypothetical protein
MPVDQYEIDDSGDICMDKLFLYNKDNVDEL